MQYPGNRDEPISSRMKQRWRSRVHVGALVACCLAFFDFTSLRAETGDQAPAPVRVEEHKIFHGVPVLIVRPKELSPRMRLVVLYHGFGPPESPQALSRALPLEKLQAVLAYVNLPLMAERLPAGGIDELKRVQANDFVNGLFFPSINGAATELPMLVREITTAYHLDSHDGIGLFGFSAGGAAALLALIESDVPVVAAAILNAPLSVSDNVKNWERALKRPFQWNAASREAASRYDVEHHADQIASRRPQPALLLMSGGADESFDTQLRNGTIDALRLAYEKMGARPMFEVKVIPDLKHNFSSESKSESALRDSKNDEIEHTVEQWFERFLGGPRKLP